MLVERDDGRGSLIYLRFSLVLVSWREALTREYVSDPQASFLITKAKQNVAWSRRCCDFTWQDMKTSSFVPCAVHNPPHLKGKKTSASKRKSVVTASIKAFGPHLRKNENLANTATQQTPMR